MLCQCHAVFPGPKFLISPLSCFSPSSIFHIKKQWTTFFCTRSSLGLARASPPTPLPHPNRRFPRPFTTFAVGYLLPIEMWSAFFCFMSGWVSAPSWPPLGHLEGMGGREFLHIHPVDVSDTCPSCSPPQTISSKFQRVDIHKTVWLRVNQYFLSKFKS